MERPKASTLRTNFKIHSGKLHQVRGLAITSVSQDSLFLCLCHHPLESSFLFQKEKQVFAAEYIYQPVSYLWNFMSLTVFFHFFLSLSLSIFAVSIDGTVLRNLCFSHIHLEDFLHCTRGSSTDLPQIILCLFLASSKMSNSFHETHT